MSDLALLLRDLPDDALVPVRWLRERLEAPAVTPNDAPVDLSCEEVARRLGRKACTVRGWCASGVIPRAYRLRGREYRIPQASLREFLDRQAAEEQEPGSATPVDLGAWKRVRR